MFDCNDWLQITAGWSPQLHASACTTTCWSELCLKAKVSAPRTATVERSISTSGGSASGRKWSLMTGCRRRMDGFCSCIHRKRTSSGQHSWRKLMPSTSLQICSVIKYKQETRADSTQNRAMPQSIWRSNYRNRKQLIFYLFNCTWHWSGKPASAEPR